MSKKTAIVTGILGQDGPYLAQHLLSLDYKVYGMMRRYSNPNFSNLDYLGITNDVEYVSGDLIDESSLMGIIKSIKPTEFYNLAAQSHVAVSFDQPRLTAEVDAIALVYIMDAIKNFSPTTRFYQASTSELFGNNHVQGMQDMETAFHPRSPYATAKLYAHWLTINYREAYKLHTSCGILFNHETMAENMPIIFKENNTSEIDIKPIGEVVRNNLVNDTSIMAKNHNSYIESKPDNDILIWDKNDWTKVIFASGYPHDKSNDNKKPKVINARKSTFIATGDHIVFKKDDTEIPVNDIKQGDKLRLVSYPDINEIQDKQTITKEEAELLGLIVSDGYTKINGTSSVIVTGQEPIGKLDKCAELWSTISKDGLVHFSYAASGFSDNKIPRITLVQSKEWISQFAIYNEDHTKRIPKQILNANTEIMLAFLRGYYMGDGLKATNTIYEFSNFKTNSPVLASSLLFLVSKTTKQDYNITVEPNETWDGGEDFYYSVNLLSNSPRSLTKSKRKAEMVISMLADNISGREISRTTGISRKFISKVSEGYKPTGIHHLKKDEAEVKKIIEYDNYDGWFYDLTTESGTFHCGVGQTHVHNSPIRGKEFVTRKITDGVAQIKAGLTDHISLGNMDAKRDWGFAGDYVKAMHLMLQQDNPKDYIVSTNETHSVREFVIESFKCIGVDEWEKHIRMDPRYMRPSEVDELCGVCKQTNEDLGWEPEVRFKGLVKMMVDADVKRYMEGK